MRAHLLTIGDEILIGQIVDTNSAWMSQQLNLYGIEVTGKSSVGDTRDAIIAGFNDALKNADVVISTGGLGPTKDDITKKTLAERFESSMAFDLPTYQRIEGYFEKIGRPTPPAMMDQATLPTKAVILPNMVGTAPGMWFEENGKVIISLPGVPHEMQHLMSKEVIPNLLAKFPSRPIVHRTLLTAGEGESNIANRIEAFENALPPHIKLAYLPALGQVRLRLTGISNSNEITTTILEHDLEALKGQLERLIPDLVYGYDEQSLEQVVGLLLRERGLMMGTAESCTGGYVAHLMTLVPGSSEYFSGSLVTYSYDLKTRLLGVSPETLALHGAVSEACVREMALNALDRLKVDIAVSISGIAGPGGGTPEKPVGTVWFAVADRSRVVTAKQIFGRDRKGNIQLTGTYALNMVRRFLLNML